MGTYADTSSIVDGQQIDAADVKAPIDALDTALAAVAAAPFIVVSASGDLTNETTLATALASPPAIGGTTPAAGSFTLVTALPAASEGIYLGQSVPAATKGGSVRYSTANDRLEIDSIHQGTGVKSLVLNPSGGGVRVNASGSTLSFFGGSFTAKQTVTGSRGGNAALASLLTALAAYGLLTDSSS